MLARMQRRLLAAWVVGLALWLAASVASGSMAVAVLGAALFLGGHALVLGLETVWAWWSQRDRPASRPAAAVFARAWLRECVTSPQVFGWRQPFRANEVPDHLPVGRPAGSPERPAVLLVHGYVCNRAFWTPLMRELAARDVAFVAVNLEPVFGDLGTDYPDAIEAGMRRLEAVTTERPLVIAHSMGGLAVRSWLRRHQGLQRVRRVITLATPHQGARLARWARRVPGTQMREGAPWLAELSAAEPAGIAGLIDVIWTACDNVVFPPRCCELPGARHWRVDDAAHVDLVFRPAVMRALLRAACGESAALEALSAPSASTD